MDISSKVGTYESAMAKVVKNLALRDNEPKVNLGFERVYTMNVRELNFA